MVDVNGCTVSPALIDVGVLWETSPGSVIVLDEVVEVRLSGITRVTLPEADSLVLILDVVELGSLACWLNDATEVDEFSDNKPLVDVRLVIVLKATSPLLTVAWGCVGIESCDVEPDCCCVPTGM